MPGQIGRRDIHIAILKTYDTTATTYDLPIKIERVISAKLSPKSNSDNIYSDDAVEDIYVEIEVSQLSITSREKLQGAKVEKGVFIENKDDMPSTIALGFKSKKKNVKFR